MEGPEGPIVQVGWLGFGFAMVSVASLNTGKGGTVVVGAAVGVGLLGTTPTTMVVGELSRVVVDSAAGASAGASGTGVASVEAPAVVVVMTGRLTPDDVSPEGFEPPELFTSTTSTPTTTRAMTARPTISIRRLPFVFASSANGSMTSDGGGDGGDLADAAPVDADVGAACVDGDAPAPGEVAAPDVERDAATDPDPMSAAGPASDEMSAVGPVEVEA